MAPAAVHHGPLAALTEQRAITLDAAFAAHPIRFKGVAPKPPSYRRRLDQPTKKGQTSHTDIKPACSLNS